MQSNTPASPRSGRIVLAATILGSSMAFLDGTVVNVALPALQTAFHASIADVQWAVEAYALMLAALLLVGGSLGDMLGRRKMYVLGVAVFAAASAWCGFARGIERLIYARSVQGIGAALLVPGSLAIIQNSLPAALPGFLPSPAVPARILARSRWTGATFNRNQTHAARFLDISGRTLIYRMKKCGLSSDLSESDRPENWHATQ